MSNKFMSFKVAFVLLTLICFASTAMAHAAIVWAYVENNQVFVEAFFANDTKIQNSKVVVLDENDNILLEGKTDVEGKFSYTPTSKKKQTIVVMAGESHLGDFELSEEDLSPVVLPAK